MRALARRSLVVVAVAAAVVGLAACSSTPESTTASSVGATLSASPSRSASDSAFFGVAVSGSWGSKPLVQVGDEADVVDSLQIEDVLVGTGTQALPTSQVTVQYVARGARTKRTFDSSWERGTPYSYDSAKMKFPAFFNGVPGMRVGGRRIVIVPGAAAFGATPPASSGLKPNETVVFVIDLVKVG